MPLSVAVRSILLTLALPACGACTGVLGGVRPEPPQTVVVDNGDFHTVMVSLEREGTRIPLGSVPGLARRSFRLSATSLGGAAEVRLSAASREVGSPDLVVGIPIQPGGRVEWTLLSGLRHQTLAIR